MQPPAPYSRLACRRSTPLGQDTTTCKVNGFEHALPQGPMGRCIRQLLPDCHSSCRCHLLHTGRPWVPQWAGAHC